MFVFFLKSASNVFFPLFYAQDFLLLLMHSTQGLIHDMMKKQLIILYALLLAAPSLRAQPQPCGKPASMTSFCNQACVICDINGFTGINNSNIVGQAPPGFCTNTVHHMQWIGFIAGSTNLTLSIKVYGCKSGDGLEVGIYESLDCKTFKLVSNCDTDIPNNTTQNFTNTTPLVIGQYYYFVMDGNGGDICNYTINVVSGTTKVPPLPDSGVITGDALACIGTTSKYTVQLPPGASRFTWSLNGAQVANGQDTTLSVNWNTAGTYNLCVIASNACDTAAPACRTVVVKAIAPTVITKQVCEGECFQVVDTMLCDAGQYDFHLAGSDGCDSLVRVHLEVLPASFTNLNLLICEGDTIFVGTHPYFKTGQYQELLATNQNACDSTVNLTLKVIVCEIKGKLSASPATCNDTPTGSLQFTIQNGTPPFQYKWERIVTGTPTGTGGVANLNVPEKIDQLPAGTYFVTVSDGFGHQVVLFENVTEPPVLTVDAVLSHYNGSNLSCKGAKNGAVALLATGGKPPYQYLWSTGSSSANISGLGAGAYTCTLTDAAGCVQVVPQVLTEPDTLALQSHFDNPGCGGANTGSAHVMATTGGTPPYEYALSGPVFGSKTDFLDLLPGNYTLTVRDANGCMAAQSGALVAPLIPDIELGPDLTVDLGERVGLELLHNVPLDTFIWAARPGLSCYNCPEPDAMPVRTTTYRLSVVAPGGCTDVDSVTVRVRERRNVYVPNSFSPNDDGYNDRFTVYAGPEVMLVKKLQVYSRWGELLFDGNDLPPNEDYTGWDGRFHGRDLPPGVFTWLAEVEFIDGVVTLYRGSVTVVW